MDEFNDFNFFSESYYNPNNYNFNKNFSLTNSLKYDNYNNHQDNRFKIYSPEQIIDSSQNSISLFQIKNDLDILNNKMNAISQTLYNMNKFNISSKKKINLKKSNSMKSKYNQNIYQVKFNNNINGIPCSNIKGKINKNHNESYNNNKINNDYFENRQDCFYNNYFANSMKISRPKNNKKIQNINKISKNNSISGLNLNKINGHVFNEALNINDLILSENKNFKRNNNTKNNCFGLYDRYFFENLTNNNIKMEKNGFKTITSNKQKNKSIIINQSKNDDNKDTNIYNNKNNNKYINYNNTLKNKLNLIFSQKQTLPKKLNNQNKIKNNHLVDDKKINEKENNKINDDGIRIENKNRIIKNLDKKIINIKEEQKSNKEKKIIKNKNKNKKNLSIHEEDNITIEYSQKDEITKINVYNFFGENQNFQSRNINVVLEKLKRRKTKNNSILSSNSPKKILSEKENKNQLNENKKIKRSFSAASICSDKEKLLLKKYKLKRRNSNSKKNKNYAKKRNKICDKFRNNPQSFYGEELCDLVLKSFDIEGIHLNYKDIKTRNNDDKIQTNLISNKKENKTEIDVNEKLNKYLQNIVEEEE